MRKFQIRMGFIKFLKKTLRFLFVISPNKKMSSVYRNQTTGLSFLTFKEICLYYIDKYGSIIMAVHILS